MSARDAAGAQPTEEELREYVAQLRQAPVSQVIGEVASALLNAAQFKLGRRDARLLLDLAAQVANHTRPHLDPTLVREVDDALARLRMGQVQAERELQARGDAAEDNDLADTPAAATGPGGQPPAPGQPAGEPARPGQSSAASRLWVPGRP